MPCRIAEALGTTEIQQYQGVVVSDHDVAWVRVGMEYAAVQHLGEPGIQQPMQDHTQALRVGVVQFIQHGGEFAAVHEFGGQHVAAAMFCHQGRGGDAVDACQLRADLRHHPGFALIVQFFAHGALDFTDDGIHVHGWQGGFHRIHEHL